MSSGLLYRDPASSDVVFLQGRRYVTEGGKVQTIHTYRGRPEDLASFVPPGYPVTTEYIRDNGSITEIQAVYHADQDGTPINPTTTPIETIWDIRSLPVELPLPSHPSMVLRDMQLTAATNSVEGVTPEQRRFLQFAFAQSPLKQRDEDLTYDGTTQTIDAHIDALGADTDGRAAVKAFYDFRLHTEQETFTWTEWQISRRIIFHRVYAGTLAADALKELNVFSDDILDFASVSSVPTVINAALTAIVSDANYPSRKVPYPTRPKWYQKTSADLTVRSDRNVEVSEVWTLRDSINPWLFKDISTP